jgi:hypothetical protein
VRAQHCDCRYRRHRHRSCGNQARLPWWTPHESDPALLWWGHRIGRASLVVTRFLVGRGTRMLTTLIVVVAVLILAGALGLLASALVSMAR